ncbi:MAG: AMP-binding protein, partial [Firmicutes bacterium]|nr:AMP-binding protein [Bacillota bacterium]
MDGLDATQKIYKALPGQHNLIDYFKTCEEFKFADIEKEFSWHRTGKVNIAYEAVDRNVEEKGLADAVALYYSYGLQEIEFTFSQIKQLSDKFANVLRKHGIKRRDRVGIFMPRSPELYITFLGIFKAGAVAVPLFEAFMEEALLDRLLDSGASVLITTSDLITRVPRDRLPDLRHVILIDRKKELPNVILYQEAMSQASTELQIAWLDLETPMLLHYTSGSTGKPKGILHVHGAMVQHYQTAKWVLDLKETDLYWCTADPGWVTGTVYGIFAPWLCGVTSLVLGGRFEPERWYKFISQHKVTVWYTAPTALRMLMAAGDDLTSSYDLSSLRHILSVGEPLNPEVISWAQRVLGLAIHDTWWMTETGGIIVANYPGMQIKPGSMGRPFPGITVAILDDMGQELPAGSLGQLAIKTPWPSMFRVVWKNQAK